MKTNNPFIFYEYMKYPIPSPSWYFMYWEKINNQQIQTNKHKASWENQSVLFDEYRTIINKRKNIFRYIPFINEVYVCNSFSFNGLSQQSDIDLFIICRDWFIWRARFRSLLIFTILNIKRCTNITKKRFCLSFYVTNKNKWLYHIAHQTDIYLAYWLAHLIPIYYINKSKKNTIYQSNKRITSYLPNFPLFHVFDVDINPAYWKTRRIKRIENLLSTKLWILLQKSLKIIRLPIILYKKKKLGKSWKKIIISNTMLKFYKDKRSYYNFFIARIISRKK